MFKKYPDRNPQWLTEHKMAMVSNKFLAALAVDLDLDKYMIVTTPALISQCNAYAFKIREVLVKGKKNLRPDFWVETTRPPKALSDLVESYIGAVLVDSDFDYSEIEKFFEKHILWYFKSLEMYDTFANRHPTSYVHRRLTGEYGCRDYKILCSDPIPGEGEVSITAGILIHNKVVASSKGTSGNYAKVRASKECLALLDGLTIADFRQRFECDCRREDAGEEAVGIEEFDGME
jgi:endoribonuclease Dicer